MKKLLSLFLVFTLLSVSLFGIAEASYSIQALPELYESDEPAEYFIDHIMPVKLGWETVFHEDKIHAYICLPYRAEQLVDVILTDCFTVVHGEITNISHGLVYVEFQTEKIQRFMNKGAYLVFICRSE